MITEIHEYNKWLFSIWKGLESKCFNLTAPYLVVPTKDYEDAEYKVLVLNKEPNRWASGEGESRESPEDIERVYEYNINEEWNNLGSVWPMYYALRELSEGDNIVIPYKIGFVHSNVALIGKEGEYGFVSEITEELKEAFAKQLAILKPNMILMGIGFTKSSTPQSYIDIIASSHLGKLLSVDEVPEVDGLFKLKFEHSEVIEIYGYRHPQGLSYSKIVQYIKKQLVKLTLEGIK